MEGIAALTPSGAGATPSASAFGKLGSEEFVKIIFTELAHQDPMAPNDSKALLEQLSSLRAIQSDTDLSQRLSAIVAQGELSGAAGLIGRNVSGLSESGARVAGLVSSVSRTSAGAVLNLSDGTRVPMSRMDEVRGTGGGA